jgi:hypothetical protein
MYLHFPIIFVVFSDCNFRSCCHQSPQELNHTCYKNNFLTVGSKHNYIEQSQHTEANSWSDKHVVPHILRNP